MINIHNKIAFTLKTNFTEFKGSTYDDRLSISDNFRGQALGQAALISAPTATLSALLSVINPNCCKLKIRLQSRLISFCHSKSLSVDREPVSDGLGLQDRGDIPHLLSGGRPQCRLQDPQEEPAVLARSDGQGGRRLRHQLQGRQQQVGAHPRHHLVLDSDCGFAAVKVHKDDKGLNKNLTISDQIWM